MTRGRGKVMDGVPALGARGGWALALLLLGACASTEEPPPTIGFEEREKPGQVSPVQEPSTPTEAGKPETRRPRARSQARTKPPGAVIPPAGAPGERSVSPPPSPPPDTTVDREETHRDARLTPFDQSEAPSDLEITRTIRRALIKDDTLSFRAKNIIIVTEGGQVTLSGSVTSRSEADRIKAIAVSVTQKDVEDRLEVHD